jgi:hypothetical protein
MTISSVKLYDINTLTSKLLYSKENRSKSQLDLQQYLDEAVSEENRSKPSQLASQAQDKGFLFIKL